jgi:hypothetical protein
MWRLPVRARLGIANIGVAKLLQGIPYGIRDVVRWVLDHDMHPWNEKRMSYVRRGPTSDSPALTEELIEFVRLYGYQGAQRRTSSPRKVPNYHRRPRQLHTMLILKLRQLSSHSLNHPWCRTLIIDLQIVEDLTLWRTITTRLRHRQHLIQWLILQSRTSRELHLFQSLSRQWQLQRRHSTSGPMVRSYSPKIRR